MYATIRRYTANPGLADKFAARSKDIENLIRPTPGFIAYYMVKTPDGAVTVTVCDSQSGAETSNRTAADWIKQNMPTIVSKPPEIYAGDAVITTTAQTGAMRASRFER